MAELILTKRTKIITNQRQISPREFLEWAKQDLIDDNKRNIGNAIGNIKKSIHCRIDELIDLLHIKYCKGWRPELSTNEKLEILKSLEIKYSSIVNLLTDIRNEYEHGYKIVEYSKAQAYLDITEMWLDHSYDNYNFYKLGIIGLKTKRFGISSTKDIEEKLMDIEFEGEFNFDYLWEAKKEIHEIKNGVLNIIQMSKVDWKKMLKYESKHIKKLIGPNRHFYILNGAILTRVYKKALKYQQDSKA